MPGPPPTPTVIKLLRGNPGRRRINRHEPMPACGEAVPEPPDFLAPDARDEWWRVAPELWHLGVLTVLDVNLFGAYCQSYARWRLAEEALQRMVDRDPVMNGFIIRRKDGEAAKNPLVKAARDAARDMIMFAGQFGIGAAARARISAGIAHEPPSKFGDLLA